jgi:hypothetical protein
MVLLITLVIPWFLGVLSPKQRALYGPRSCYLLVVLRTIRSAIQLTRERLNEYSSNLVSSLFHWRTIETRISQFPTIGNTNATHDQSREDDPPPLLMVLCEDGWWWHGGFSWNLVCDNQCYSFYHLAICPIFLVSWLLVSPMSTQRSISQWVHLG